jgi:metallo-beta-lactamase family protein
VKLSFHGADREVTGSCHLVECGGKRVLIDCGEFQGSRELEEENARAFGFDPAAIDFVILTHAHLDHCGRLPLLAKRGFRGEIIATAATRELARLVMLDAANIEEEDARTRQRRAMRRGRASEALQPLYSMVDALAAFDRFGRTASYGIPVEVAAGIRATFIDAGHILGSSAVLFELSEGDKRQRILFSGDLGNPGRPLLNPPAVPPEADLVVMESTYGDRLHRPMPASIDEFIGAIGECFTRGGNVLIPTFALERAQELLFLMRDGIEKARLNPSLQVFLDSPMAITATEIFRHHPESLKPDLAAMIGGGRDPFALPGLHLTRESAASMAINRIRSGAVIMAGSGMATGGRIRHHLKHNLWRRECSVVFVGYAGIGTLARQIIDGAETVRIFDEEIRVRATIHTINGFSAHADQADLIAWHSQTGARRTFLVHGEESVMRTLAGKLANTSVEMPALDQAYDL